MRPGQPRTQTGMHVWPRAARHAEEIESRDLNVTTTFVPPRTRLVNFMNSSLNLLLSLCRSRPYYYVSLLFKCVYSDSVVLAAAELSKRLLLAVPARNGDHTTPTSAEAASPVPCAWLSKRGTTRGQRLRYVEREREREKMENIWVWLKWHKTAIE